MKNKKVITTVGVIVGILLILSMLTLVIRATDVARSVEANITLQKETNADNKVKVALETSPDQSISSFNISLSLETENIEDIKGVTIDWNSDISNDAELQKLTYNDNRINIYVVSKNELGDNNETQKRIEVGTITIETEDKENIDVTIRASKNFIKIASLKHELATISNEAANSIRLVINEATYSEEENQGGSNDNQEEDNGQVNNDEINNDQVNDNANQSENNGSNGGNKGGSGSHSENNDQEENEGYDEENIIQNEEENQLDDVNIVNNNNVTEEDNLLQGKLPQTGETTIRVAIFIIAIAVIIILITIIIKSRKKD